FAAVGGVPPYSWSLAQGSTLPAGLSISPAGFVSGALASSVGTGDYTFTASVADSSVPPLSAARQFTLPVGPPTGALCNNISWNVSGTNSPILPLDVLGSGTYLGSQGGLYPGGSNIRPSDHTAFGLQLAQGIQPLNASGQPDPNGKEVIVILGESNVEIEGEGITEDSAADPLTNPSVLVVNAALGDATAANLSQKTSGFWSTILNNILPNYGVTPKQVVAAWLEPNDGVNSGRFPADISKLQSQIENISRNLLGFFPNIKLAYFSSRIYSGYSNGLNTTNPEPYAFEDSFAVKWAIQDQLNGKSSLNFDPSKGPVQAPWMSWGPYTWANGLVVPSTAGYFWSCQDQKDDGTHPNKTTGKEEVATQVVNFFKTDPTTTPWFLAH
ncbi:MAG: putative Ig domain-containing protein, partial [Acidobacteriales bacterium]|nr:putative Ig domain-containing protein [Terriglobales bacterium]